MITEREVILKIINGDPEGIPELFFRHAALFREALIRFHGEAGPSESEPLSRVIHTLISHLKDEIKKSFLSIVGYLFVRPAFKNFRKKVDYSEYGGAPLLGINGVGMICHGGSSVKAIKNAIRFAHDYAQKGVNQKMAEKLKQYITDSKQQREASNDQAVG